MDWLNTIGIVIGSVDQRLTADDRWPKIAEHLAKKKQNQIV